MPQTTLKSKPTLASQKVKPKIDTVRLEQLVTQCLLKDVPLSIITDSYDVSYKQMGLLINMTSGFERQTSKMDHTFDSFTYESIPEDYFAIPHVLPEEKHYKYDKVMELFAELEEIKNKKILVVSIDTNFIKLQIQKQKDKLASYDAEKIKNIQGFINEFDELNSHRQPTPEVFLYLLNKYNLNMSERDSLNKLYEDYLNDQNLLLKLEQKLIHQQQQDKEQQKLERRYKQIKDDLVIHNIKLVNWCIRKFFNGIPLPKEDAQAIGLEGLSNAINQFDYKKGFHFSTYAVPAIVHNIQRYFKDLTGYKWEDYIKINSINYYRNLMQLESGSDHRPTPEELADMGLLDLSSSQIKKYDLIEAFGKVEPLSSIEKPIELDYPATKRFEMPMTQEDYDVIDTYEDIMSSAVDLLEDYTSTKVSDIAYTLFARDTIFELLETLTPREQHVLEHLYGLVDGRAKSLEETGQIFNVTRERIRQIEAKALRKLRHPYRAKHVSDYLDMDFGQIDQPEHRPKTHIAIEQVYRGYYTFLELGLDEQTITEKLYQEADKNNPYRIEYLLEKLPNIEESIINQSIQGTPIGQIRFSIYNHHGTFFSNDFIISVLNRNKEKLPESVLEKLEHTTKKM